MLSLCYDVSYMPIVLLHAYCSNAYVNSVSAPQLSRLLSTGEQHLKRVYNWSKHFCPVIFFFNMGTTIACLRQSGNTPEHNDLFTISTISGTMQSNCSFNSQVGTGS